METTKTKPIHLNFKSTRQVVVAPDDEDRFVTTEGEAAKACKRAEDDKDFRKQFQSSLAYLNEWCEKFAGKVQAAYLTVGDSSLNVLICMRGEDYDFDFSDILVELDVKLAQSFPLCVFEVLQIPNQDALTRDLPGEGLWVYGDGSRARETS